jgi:hypothetical protein
MPLLTIKQERIMMPLRVCGGNSISGQPFET